MPNTLLQAVFNGGDSCNNALIAGNFVAFQRDVEVDTELNVRKTFRMRTEPSLKMYKEEQDERNIINNN